MQTLDETNPDIRKELYPIGDTIFKKGDLGQCFYIVEKGKVSIFDLTQDGKKVPIATIGEGEAFGEFALLDKKPRSATAQAASDVVLIKVSDKGYEQMLTELPGWATSMMLSFIERLRNMNTQLTEKHQFIHTIK